MSEVMTQAVVDVRMCCRVIALLLGDVFLDAGEGMFEELRKLRSSSAQDTATSPMVYTVSCALINHDDYGPVMQELITREKNIIKAASILQKCYADLQATEALAMGADHSH